MMTLMIACSPSTKLERTWTDPSLTPETVKPFKKVLVIARIKDETGNRTAEDKIVAQFKPGNAVQSYSYLQPADTNQRTVDAKLQKDGFDGLLVMNLTGVNKSLSVEPGGYGGFYGRGYYGGYYGTSVSEDRTFLVETKIYSLETSKLLWSGTTSTFNPTSLNQSLDEIIAAIKMQLTKQGLIKQ